MGTAIVYAVDGDTGAAGAGGGEIDQPGDCHWVRAGGVFFGQGAGVSFSGAGGDFYAGDAAGVSAFVFGIDGVAICPGDWGGTAGVSAEAICVDGGAGGAGAAGAAGGVWVSD